MIKIKVAFLEGRLLSSQSEQSKKFSKSPDWLEKKLALRKSCFYFDHVNRLFVSCKSWGLRFRYSFIWQGTSTSWQWSDLFGLQVKSSWGRKH